MTERRGLTRAPLMLVVAVAISATPAAAGNYRWVAPDGTVTYSDQPPRVNATTIAPPSAPPVVSPLAPPRPREIEPLPLPAGPAATVDEILDISGITRQIGALSAGLTAEFKAPPSFSAKERAAVERVAERHFHRDRLLRSITEELRRRHDQRRLDAVAAWLRSPLGQKVTALEIAASLESHTERRPSVAPPSPPRAALMEQLDWLGGLTESRLDGMLAVARATATSITGVLPAEQRKTPAQIERDLQRARAHMRPQVEQATLQHLLDQYRALEDTEVERLAAFMASEPGRWYGTVMSRALTQAIGAAATESARAMIAVVPAERWRELAMAAPPSPR